MKIISLKDNIVYTKLNTSDLLTEFEIVTFSDKQKTSGIVMTIEKQGAYIAILSEEHNLSVGQGITQTKKTFSINVPKSPIGLVFDYAGNEMKLDEKITLDKKSLTPIFAFDSNANNLPIEPPILALDTRKPVKRTLKTGLMLVDATLAIGKGQRELIVGDRQTGKTSIAIDAILNQKDQDVICIYNMIGGKLQDVVKLYEKLKNHGALNYTFIVASSSSDSSIKQWLSPYVATTFAETFRDKGKDVLIVYDDLSAHAKAYRSFNLLMGSHPGREAYPGDVFYTHSRLLERSGQFNEKAGSGSITSLPIIQTEKGNISAYIPTNVVSITDGQIFTSVELFNKNIRPAVDVNISVSRVGSNAQTKYMKSAIGPLKSLIAQYTKIKETFTSESALSKEKLAIYKKGQIVSEMFKQLDNKPFSYEFEWLVIVMINSGYFDNFEVEDLGFVKQKLLKFTQANNLANKFLLAVEENDQKLFDKAVMEFFAAQIFIPFIKALGIKMYASTQKKVSQFKNAFSNYPTASIEIDLGNESYEIYSAEGEKEVKFASEKIMEFTSMEEVK